MATTWTITDATVNHRTQVVCVTFRETLDDASTFDYVIPGEVGLIGVELRNDILKELKKRVLAARALRTQVENLKTGVNLAQLEAYINA
jgi:hypothetical protein